MSVGSTIVFSIVFMTSFHSSFSTRFSTVFSQILAKRDKLQERNTTFYSFRGSDQSDGNCKLKTRAPSNLMMNENTFKYDCDVIYSR